MVGDDTNPPEEQEHDNEQGQSDDAPSVHTLQKLPEGIGYVQKIELEDELKSAYLDYAMSVIVSRALPDVRDGLKPVHRRVLYAMHEGGYEASKPYRKSARIVGDVIGKYHPHSNDPIYEALVRMAQDFSLLIPLLDGQGNFGSVDGDPPAAMRYTEIRLAKVASALLQDIERDSVDFQPNYDGSEHEPVVLPARLPNLLVNGSGGIAVGMATNIPPHNLGEVIDACQAMIANPDVDDAVLRQHIKGPDFPTGGIIIGNAGIISAYQTGRGRVVIRSRVEVEQFARDRQALIVTEIPYQVNKAVLIERIADLAREKRVEGISDIRDESDRKGMRIVIELRRDAIAEVVRNQLFQYSALQSSFSCNLVALHKGRPSLFDLRRLLAAFIEFREQVVTRRTRFLLRKARDRAHIVAGLSVAVANIDEMIRVIRSSPTPAEARRRLLEKAWPIGDLASLLALVDDPRHVVQEDGKFKLSLEQVRAILELRLHRLTALGGEEIAEELNKLASQITDFLEILSSRERLMDIVSTELSEVRDLYAKERRTEIIVDDSGADVDVEDLIKREDMVVTVSRLAYIKRVPLATYRSQRRGGKGRAAMSTREEDCVTRLFVASTHAPVLFFASGGKAYKLKVWRLPAAQPQARGKPLVNLLPLSKSERISSILLLPEDSDELDNLWVMFATRMGYIRRNRLSDFGSVNRGGKIAMRLTDDELVDVLICRPDQDVLLTTAHGRCVRFPVTNVRVFAGRGSHGVRGIKLRKNDKVISMSLLSHVEASPDERAMYLRQASALRRAESGESGGSEIETVLDSEASGTSVTLNKERITDLENREQFVLTIAENGFGKRTSSYDYRTSGRAIQGVTAMTVNDRNGHLVAAFPVEQDDQIMLVTDHGRLIRCPIRDVRISGRSTQGVKLLDVGQGERIVGVERLSESDDAEADSSTEADGTS